jgi:hypothetical protein
MVGPPVCAGVRVGVKVLLGVSCCVQVAIKGELTARQQHWQGALGTDETLTSCRGLCDFEMALWVCSHIINH